MQSLHVLTCPHTRLYIAVLGALLGCPDPIELSSSDDTRQLPGQELHANESLRISNVPHISPHKQPQTTSHYTALWHHTSRPFLLQLPFLRPLFCYSCPGKSIQIQLPGDHENNFHTAGHGRDHSSRFYTTFPYVHGGELPRFCVPCLCRTLSLIRCTVWLPDRRSIHYTTSLGGERGRSSGGR